MESLEHQKNKSSAAQYLGIALKILIVSALLYWLITSDKLDFSLVTESFHYPLFCGLGVLGFVAMILIGAYRWFIIIKQLSGEEISFKGFFSLTWIGFFFGVALPGALTGDVIKIYLTKKIKPNLSTTQIVTSALIDRIYGLIAFLLIMGVSAIVFYSGINETNKQIYLTNFMALAAFVFILALFYLPIKKRFKIKAINILLDHQSKLKEVNIRAILLSLLGQSVTLLVLALFGQIVIGNFISMDVLTLGGPLSLMTTTIPIAPAGIGVGHAAFEKIFQLLGQGNGANIFNLYFVWFTFFRILGFIPYLILKKKD